MRLLGIRKTDQIYAYEIYQQQKELKKEHEQLQSYDKELN
jgi:predicted HTH domain antitoxin